MLLHYPSSLWDCPLFCCRPERLPFHSVALIELASVKQRLKVAKPKLTSIELTKCKAQNQKIIFLQSLLVDQHAMHGRDQKALDICQKYKASKTQ